MQKYFLLGTIFIQFSFLCSHISQARQNSNEYTFRAEKNFTIYQIPNPQDTIVDDTIPDTRDNGQLIYPFEDDDGNPFTKEDKSPLFLDDPSNVKTEIEFNYNTGEYDYLKKVGELNYRTPRSMTIDEYQDYDFEHSLEDYWQQRITDERMNAKGTDPFSKFLNPKLNIPIEGFDKIFGTSTIDIKPRGSAELIFGININKQKNPSLPKRLQNHVAFDFDEKIQMGVTGSIGDKMKVGINYNTEATFDFENETKLGYTGKEDEIIQNIEAGNVSLPLSGTLITGSHSLFGLKTELKFGKLYVTNVFSQQRGESQSIEIKGGAQIQEYEVYADEYEENRHFFLSHYFRNRYEQAMSTLPAINSPVEIQWVEVWVLNKSGDYEESRNIAAFMDLAEPDSIFNPSEVSKNPSVPYADNDANSLYEEVKSKGQNIRTFSNVVNSLPNFELGADYEVVENAQKLTEREFDYDPKLGYISLNRTLAPDEVLAVAYEYKLVGANQTITVGERSTDIEQPKTLIVKLLKGSNPSTQFPNWNLMMKNVYNIGAYGIERENFQLQIMYKNDKTGTSVNYIPAGAIDKEVLLQVFNLDRLDSQNDAKPDGYFDFIQGKTITKENGRIFFPVLEPFGSFLEEQIIDGNPEFESEAEQYVFKELYRKTKTEARQYAEKNKFYLAGEYQSSSGSEIMLNAMNIPEGSVVVTAGGAKLTENVDYTVDYALGRVTIINQSLLESATPIRVSLESNALFAMQTKTMIGTHLDYKFSDNFQLGGTMLHLSEKPLTNKVGFGDEAIANTIWGIDGSYSTEAPWLTKAVDKLPFIETKERSTITMTGEFAHLIPGHSRALKRSGVSYIDDFEGAKTTITLKTPESWFISSTPVSEGPHIQPYFPEASLTNNLAYGFNRAKINWYSILSDLQRSNAGTPDNLKNNKNEQSNHFVREVFERDLFPERESPNNFPTVLNVLNVAYYPKEKGPYNFDTKPTTYSAGIDQEGKLKEPESRWGGIMRRIQSNDFESQNIEYIEFWLMDPFVDPDGDELPGEPINNTGGDLYFHLGNISEDVLKDSKKSFEQGLPTEEPVEADDLDTTEWGVVPVKQALQNAFNNDPASKAKQDIGLDGLTSQEELLFYEQFMNELDSLFENGSINPDAYDDIRTDPASDDFIHFKDDTYNKSNAGILERYKQYNGLEGNSGEYPNTGTLLPDVEDINFDNTVNPIESYFQYHVSLRKEDLEPGKNYIVDEKIDKKERKNGKETEVKWYHFRIPIRDFQSRVGAIQDFRSIRFMRMLMTQFREPAVLRFAELQLVRGEWRQYAFDISEGGESTNIPETGQSSFEISAVNIEEDGNRANVNYVLPPGVDRVIDPTNPKMRQLNEQAVTLKVVDLQDGDARAAYKNVQLDLRMYKNLKMYIHAEEIEEGSDLRDEELTAFIRIGSDYTQNYYEYEIPLKLTPFGFYVNESEADRKIVWPEDNNLDISFTQFTDLKLERNSKGFPITSIYEKKDENNTVRVVGSPNLGDVRTIMLGVRNPKTRGNFSEDDGLPKSGEIWMNELRLTNFNEKGGWAAHARVSARLADFGSVKITGNKSTPGFGSIEKKVNERQKEDITDYDISSTFELGKFFPKKYGVRIPLYVGYSESFITPQFNPVDQDIEYDKSIKEAENDSVRDYIKEVSRDYTRRKSINISNMSITNPSGKEGEEATGKRPFYSLSNFSLSTVYNEIYHSDVKTEYDRQTEMGAIISYNYSGTPKNIVPLQRLSFLNKPAFRLIKDFNFNLGPRQVAFRNDMNRTYNEVLHRNLSNPDLIIPGSYRKDFDWRRVYDIKYDLSKSLKLNFSATNTARVDEPEGRIYKEEEDYDEKVREIWQNVKDWGRNTSYVHRFEASWNVPINKIPLLDWVNMNARYSSDYSWNTGNLIEFTDSLGNKREIDLGNKISNASSVQINSQFNIQNLYNKAPFLKKISDDLRRSQSGRQQKEKKEVTYEEENVNLRGNRAKIITHRLGTEDVNVTVTDENGNTIESEIEIISSKKVAVKVEETIRNVRVNVTGNKEVRENIFITIGKYTVNAIMGIKNFGISYSTGGASFIPGYTPKTNMLGLEKIDNTLAPGVPFILGVQEDGFIDYAAENRWLTKESSFNTEFMLDKNESLNIRTSVEPLPGLRIDLNAMSRSSESKTENRLWDELGTGDSAYVRSNISERGSHSISYNLINTAFWRLNEDYKSDAYEKFLSYRPIIAQRLAAGRSGYEVIFDENNQLVGTMPYDPNRGEDDPVPVFDPYTGELKLDSAETHKGYPSGYSPSSAKVMIPAFLAAYSGQDPEKVSLKQMPGFLDIFPAVFPFDWRLTYDGLSKIESLKDVFKSVRINHAYRSQFDVSTFVSNPDYGIDFIQQDGFSYVRDELNGYFIPEYEINSVRLHDEFSPLINIDMSWENSLMTKIEFRKSRDLVLNFSNSLLMESRNNELVVGAGYRFSAVEIIINNQRFESDLNVRADFSFKDNTTIYRRILEDIDELYSGNQNISIKFNADYVLNERFNLRFFYEQAIMNPKVSTSFPNSDIRVGFSVRFMLIQ